MMAETHFFQDLEALYVTYLFSSVGVTIDQVLAAAATVAAPLVTFYVALFGYLVLKGRTSAQDGISRMLRLAVVLMLITPAYYNTIIRDFALVEYPEWVAGIATSGAHRTDASVFDVMRNEVAKLSVAMRARLSPLEIAEKGAVWLLEIADGLFLLATFAVWMFTRALIALIITAGPIVILLALFDRTKFLVEGWVGQLGGLAVLLFLIAALLEIVTGQFISFIKAARPAIQTGTIEDGLEALVVVTLSFVFGLSLLLMLPRLAAAIGGSADFSLAAGARAAAYGALVAGRAAAGATKIATRATVGAAQAARGGAGRAAALTKLAKHKLRSK